MPDSTGQAGEAQAGPGLALGPRTAQDQAQSGSRGPREGVGRGGAVRHGSSLGQAEADPAGEGGQRPQGKGARIGGGGENRKRRQCTEYAEFFNQVIFTNESSAVGGWER